MILQFCQGYFPKNITNHGVEIHFTTTEKGVIEQISESYDIVRRGYYWYVIETEKGKYDFSQYDLLVNNLTANNIRPYFTMFGGNSLYQNATYGASTPPTTPESIAGFAEFVYESMLHFKGKGIIWELWNEPNLESFWPPKANATQYGQLALAIGKKMQSDPETKNEIYIGPAVNELDTKYLTTIFEMGLLSYFDAICFHPYEYNEIPEGNIPKFMELKQMIANYTAEDIPIIQGEWGYSTCINDEEQSIECQVNGNTGQISYNLQAIYLVRMWIMSDYMNIPITIWYDFKNDAMDPTHGEANFGTVYFTYNNETTPYDPKLSFIAAGVYKKFIGKWWDLSLGIDRLNATCNNSPSDCQSVDINAIQYGQEGSVIVMYYHPKNITINHGLNIVLDNVVVNTEFGKLTCFESYDLYGNIVSTDKCTNDDGTQFKISNVTYSPLYFVQK